MGNISSRCSWHANRLKRFKGIHAGEAAILVCNGPSLNKTDFSAIRGRTIFGLNKIYLGFQRFRFCPKYYVAINRKVIKQSWDEIRALNCIQFIRRITDLNVAKESALTHLIEPASSSEMYFSKNICEGIHEGYTVTSAALQIAYFMGFKKVVIAGMDHHFTYTGKPNEEKYLSGPDSNHFDPRYFQDKNWDNPDLANSERFYQLAREAFEADGRKIVDCTIGGRCGIFKKGKLEEEL